MVIRGRAGRLGSGGRPARAGGPTAGPPGHRQHPTELTISERTDPSARAADSGQIPVQAPAPAGIRDDDSPSASRPASGAGPGRLARPAGRALRLARRVPAVVLLITVLHVALLASYSVIYPTWTGYDEAQHVDMVYGLRHGAGWPGPGEKMISIGVAATSDDFDRGRYADMFQSGGKRRGSPSFAEITPTPRGERGSFAELGGPDPVTDGRLSNQMVQHPPLVYAAGTVLLSALPGSDNWPYDWQVYVLRLFNILLVTPLPLLAWATARRLGLPEVAAQGAAVLPLAVPGFTRVGATFNNDGILMLATGALTFVLASVLRGDRRIRTAVWAGLWLAVCLLAKGLALLLPLMAVAAYLVGWWRTRGDRDSTAGRADAAAGTGPGAGGGGRWRGLVRSLPWWPATVAVGLGGLLGGWWWVRNVVLYGAVQPNGWATNPPRREALLLPDSFFTWFWYFFRTMISRFWGGLGMFEPPQLTGVAIVTATVVVVALGGVAMANGLRPARLIPAQRPGGRRWADRLSGAAVPAVLLLPIVFAYVSVGQRSWAEYERYTRGIAVQGRYLYLGLVGLGVVVAAGLARSLGRRARWTPLVLLVGALLMQAFALLAVCSYYWLGRGVAFTPLRVPDVVNAIARWAPFPAGVTWALLSTTAALAVAVLVVVARAAVAAGPAPGPSRPAAPPAPAETAVAAAPAVIPVPTPGGIAAAPAPPVS